MDLLESDATYCSEVEKENISQLRRSKRLSQKLSESFRSDEDPVLQRFEEIHRMLEIESSCEGYTKEDWCALKAEVNSLRTSLKHISRSRLTFVIKKIEQKLRILRIDTNLQEFSKLTNESLSQLDEGISSETVKSPNVLAGMTTELLTEIPPYQPHKSSIITGMNLNTDPTGCTQINPLDLTKKQGDVCPQAKEVMHHDPKDKHVNSNLIRCPTIDLTKSSQNKENIAPRDECKGLSKDKRDETSAGVYTSKWLKYLPTQQRQQETCEKSSVSSRPKHNLKPFRESLISLFEENSTIRGLKSKELKSKQSPPRKIPGRKSKHKRDSKRSINLQYLRNTENVFSRHSGEFESFELRNVQTENLTHLPQESPSRDFGQDILTFSENNSSVSIPFSLKKRFKKVFGADIVDVLGCEKIVYSLTERHVEKLASALNVERESLKATIEKILVDDDCTQLNENDQSDASVLQCSQSPTPRLHPSQRS